MRSCWLLFAFLLDDLRHVHAARWPGAFAARATVFAVATLAPWGAVEGVTALPARCDALIALPRLRRPTTWATVAAGVAARRATISAEIATWWSVAEVAARATVTAGVATTVAAKIAARRAIIIVAARWPVAVVAILTSRRAIIELSTWTTVVVVAAWRSVVIVAARRTVAVVPIIPTRRAIIVTAARGAIIVVAAWWPVIVVPIFPAWRPVVVVAAWWPIIVVAIVAAWWTVAVVAARATIIEAAARAAVVAEIAARRAIPSLGALPVRRSLALRAFVCRVNVNRAPIHHRTVERLHGSTHRLLIG